jgi:capsular exopolysaccharide synthesis family protein
MKDSPPTSSENADSTLIDLAGRVQRFLHFLKSRWWIVVGAVALGLLGEWTYSHFRPPPAVVVSRMLVGGKIRIPDGGLYAEEWQNFFGTQVELMQGEKIRRRTLDRLRRLRQNQNESPVKIEVSQIRKTTIFVLQATGKDPTYAVNYLNALMDEYLAYRREVRSLSSDDTLASLTTQFLDQEKELKRQQEGMLEFQRTNSVALLQEQGSSTHLAKLNQELADLKLQEALLAGVIESATNSDRGQQGATKVSLAGVAVDLKPKKALEMLKFQKQEYSQSLLPDHPKMKKLDEEIARVEKLVSLYDTEEKENLSMSKTSIELKISNVEKAIKEWQDKMLDANRRLAEYTLLKENLDRVQNLYDHLLRLLQNVGLDKHVDQETVVIMDPAVEEPSKVRVLQKILAGVIGLIVGLGLVGYIATHDDRLTSLKEVKSSFPEKLLGRIPDVPLRKRKRPLEPLTAQDRRHVFAESYRAMRSSLLFLGTGQEKVRTILITSAMPGEGKSTVAANLARSLAFGGSRVVLVDGDLRTGTLHESLGLPSEPGLAQLASRKSGFASLTISTAVPNLHFIPRGAVSDDCGELFVSGELDRLLEELSANFDFVLIDCAPVFAAADSLSLAPKVDGTIFVLRGSYTRASRAREALDQLYELEVNVLGVVFNGAKGSMSCYPYFQNRTPRSSPGRLSKAVVGASAN